jgi:hypothetical protein
MGRKCVGGGGGAPIRHYKPTPGPPAGFVTIRQIESRYRLKGPGRVPILYSKEVGGIPRQSYALSEMSTRRTAALTASAPTFPVPSRRTAESMSGLYLVFACLIPTGLNRQLDRYVNPGRSGVTSPGAGFRYCLKGQYKELPYTLNKETDSFVVTDETFVKAVRDTYGEDPVILIKLKEAEARYKEALAAKGNVPAKR